MDDNIFSKVVGHVQRIVDNPGTKITGVDGLTVLFDKHYYQPIKGSFSSKVAFVDGGNGELFSGPNFSLQFVRVGSVIYSDNVRVASQKEEFYVLIQARGKGKDIFYETTVFGWDFAVPTVSVNDASLSSTHVAVSISTIGGMCRRFAELEFARRVGAGLSSGDALVLDGDLEATMNGERALLDALFSVGKTKDVLITGLAKSSRLFTDSGHSLLHAVNQLGPTGSWMYHPLVKESFLDLAILKLHADSQYVFKYQMIRAQKEKAMELVSALSLNSTDPLLLGYPYGLIDVDRLAKVRKNEQDYLRMKLKGALGGSFAQVEALGHGLDAHDKF